MSQGGRLAALTAIAVAGLGVGVAIAGVSQYPTVFAKFKYKLENGQAEFKGQIDSAKGGCVPDRKVKLLRRSKGETKKIGSDRTDGKGRFSIELGSGPLKEGTYYAKAKETKIGGQGNEKTCLARTSGSIKVS